MDLTTLSIQIVFILGFCVAAIVVFIYVGRRGRAKESSSTDDFGCFSPNELDRLKGKGLMTDTEAKKVQAILTERTLEDMEKKQSPMKEVADLNTLLAEAEKLKRQSQSAKSSSSNEEAT